MNLAQKIESYLFYTGEPVAFKKIEKVFDLSQAELREALEILEQNLQGRGIVMIKNDNEVMLGTHPEMSEFFTSIRKEELSEPLSKAALETLTIILYKDGVSKSDIDFIRGVNSGYILRNLSVRGLVEKRNHVYHPTLETLRFLGITQIEQLESFAQFRDELVKREVSHKE